MAGGFTEVVQFLRQLEHVPLCDKQELGQWIWGNRLDLVLPPRASSPDGRQETHLPRFDTMPEEGMFFEAVVRGGLPDIHQYIAHTMWPDCVPLPDESVPTEPTQADARPESAVTPQRGSPADSRNASRRLPPCGTETEEEMPPPQRPESDCSLGADDDEAKETQQPVMSSESGPAAQLSPDLAHHHGGRTASVAGLAEDTMFDVQLRGQTLTTTLRGKALHKNEDLMNALASETELSEKYFSVKQDRKKLERELMLEQYEEKKLRQRIEVLRSMKEVEEERIRTVEKRDAQRKARDQELKQKLKEGFALQEQEPLHGKKKDRHQPDHEAYRGMEEMWLKQTPDEKRRREESQKALQDWWSKQQDYPFTLERARERREELIAKKAAQLEDRAKSRVQTVTQLLAEEKVVQVREALEERPPQAPPQRDKEASLSELDIDERTDQSREREGASACRPARPTLEAQAKELSNAYGLARHEQARIRDKLERGIKGPGRMANYEKTHD